MKSTQSEIRLARLIDERELVRNKHESMLAELETREDKTLTESDGQQVKGYRERAADLDIEIRELADEIKRSNDAIEESKKLRRVIAGSTDGVQVDGDGVVYTRFKDYARDMIVTRNSPECSAIARQWGLNDQEIQAAAERLQMIKRSPDNTLSSNVAGLTPAQHIAEIFQVIDNSRPIVSTARRTDLTRGTLTYPQVDTSPVVLAQASEKTEGGTTRLAVSMQTATATTYIGGGDLSWQAINWSTPNALDLWFEFVAADYALKTEQDAAQAMQHSAFTYNASVVLDGTDDYDAWVAAIVSGLSEVYANSGRLGDTLYLAPDQFYSFAGSIPATAQAAFLSGGVSLAGQSGSFSGLRLVVSRGMDTGVAVVGDSQGLLVAETAGAPVEMRVVEPAIGGVEVGLIGAFEAVVVDAGAFAMISTAS